MSLATREALSRSCSTLNHASRPLFTLSSRKHKLCTGAATTQQRRCMTLKQLDEARDSRERVVILGSGWAGYTIARRLDPKKYQAVVVSPRSYFAFTPLLASTSVGTLEFRTALEPVRSRRSQCAYFQGWADGVDFKNKTVTIEEAVDDPTQGLAPTTDRHANETKEQRMKKYEEGIEKGNLFDLSYDKLVISVGCYSQTFGTPGVRENALFLKDVGDARKIRNRILACFEAAALPTTSEEMKKTLLNFAVVGGGPTGIECPRYILLTWPNTVSAELHDIIEEDLVRLYPELKQYYHISVYDVAPKVLPMFDEKLAKYAMETFQRDGISIKTNHHVQQLKRGSPLKHIHKSEDYSCFTLKVQEEGEIGVGMVVWSTGLMQNPFVAHALNNIPHHLESEIKVLSATGSADKTQWAVKRDEKTGSIYTDDRLRVKLRGTGLDRDSNSEAILRDVYAIGDCSILEGTAYPATAQVAYQKAEWLAKRMNKGDLNSGFTWKNMGVMAYIGNWKALLQGGGGDGISGRAAWIIWRGAYLTKTVSLRNKILIPLYWFINWIFGRDITRL